MERLGAAYWRLWSANAVSYVGDGALVTALPLYAVTVTRDPRLISLVSAAMFIPWLVLSLPAGAIVDRNDRGTLMWRSQAFQLVVIAALAAGVATRHAGIAVLTVGGLLLGSAEVFFSNAAQSVLPQLVPAGLLPRANGNQQVVQTIGETFAGPPLGSWLFAVRAALPFGLDALSFAGSAALLATLPRTRATPTRQPVPAAEPVPAGELASVGEPASARNPVPMRAQIAEGVRWLARHRLLRCVAVLLGVANFTSQMGQATLVLLATQALHTGTSGYGLLWTASAVGSVLGGVVNPVVTRRLGLISSMVVSGCAFAVLYAGTGLSPDFAVAATLMACNGFFITMWNIVTVTLRQTIVPVELLGRVNSAYRMIGWGPLPLGALAGGFIAHAIGLRAPYIIGGLLMAAGLLAAAPVLRSAARSTRVQGAVDEVQ
ncbi:MAG TPA: MFS transporter [Trebonia sp.]